jgi:hypothetical protein
MASAVDSHASAHRRTGGALTADALLEPWFAALRPRLGGVRLFDAHTHGPAPMTTTGGPGPLPERVHTLLVAAAGRLTAGHPADEYLELARLACELPADHPDAAAAASVRELLDRHAAFAATDPPRRGPRTPGVHMIFVAAAIARTGVLPLPVGVR